MAAPPQPNNPPRTHASDIGSVEVLRGPQGTLFGRNVTGGAVVVTTANPEREFSQKLRLTAGNSRRADIAYSVTGPLSDIVSMRLSAIYSHSDGYFENLRNGEDKAIAGWRDVRFDSSTDCDGSPITLFHFPDNKEDKEILFSPPGRCALNFTNCTLTLPGQRDWSNFSPKCGLEFQATEELLTYASWTRGFRSGVFNARTVQVRGMPGMTHSRAYEFA